MMKDRKNANPSIPSFFIPGGEPGVLLIHGFLTAPDEIRELGEHLAATGMTVYGIRLKGHGTTPKDLTQASWEDWRTDARQGLAKLRQTCRHISVAGLSLGGALALYVASLYPIERVVTFGAPDGLLAQHPLLRLAKPASHIIPYVPKIGSDIRDPVARRAHFTYKRIPLKSLLEIRELLIDLEGRLSRVKAPTLLIQAKNDHVVPPETAARIAGKIGGPSRIFMVERGGHTVVADYDYAIAFEKTLAWLRGDTDSI